MKMRSVMMRRNVAWIAITAIVLLSNCGGSDDVNVKPPTVETGKGTVEVYVTTGDQSRLFAKQTDISLGEKAMTSSALIELDSLTKYQQIEGFGAAMTGSSAYVINRMSASSKAALLSDLFDPKTGIGISYLRTCIGASDFNIGGDFSYDDSDGDFSLTNFSLQKDKADVIPMVQAAISINSSIKILGSPWSAPAWMKTNGDMEGGSLRSDCYDAYANYFVKYVKGMAAEGITIDAVTLQNEPLYSTAGYPCMSMTSGEQINFIKNNVGPAFTTAGLSTKIFAYDHNWDVPEYPIAVISDASASQYVAGSAFHGYGGTVGAMTGVHSAKPDKGIYFTEQSGGGWQSSDYGDLLGYFVSDIGIGTMKNWSKNFLYWNLALDENAGPTNNGCSNCRGVVTVNSGSGQVTKNVEYYSIAHFAKYVKPGAFRIASSLTGTLSGTEHVAFINADGSKVLVAMNKSGSSQPFVVVLGDRQFSYAIPAVSAVTFVWK